MIYKNRHGEAELKLHGDIVHVSTVRGACPLLFDMDTAEKLLLITENRKIQVACVYPDLTKLYAVYHHTSSAVQVAEIVSLKYTGGNPSHAIQAERC